MHYCGSRLDKLHAHADLAHLGAQNFRGMPKFFDREEKLLDLQILNRIDKTMVNSSLLAIN